MNERQNPPECIDLRERFDKKYKIAWDECRQGLERDPWLMVIPCRYGQIYPYGGAELAASADGHPRVAQRLRRLSCCRVHQDGDFGELTAVFDLDDFPTVAQVMGPRRRRQLSDRQRRVLTERILAAGKSTRFPGRKREYTDRGRDSSPPGDSEAA